VDPAAHAHRLAHVRAELLDPRRPHRACLRQPSSGTCRASVRHSRSSSG
jgi:hypothetical protein